MHFFFFLLWFSLSIENSDQKETDFSADHDSSNCLNINALTHVGFYNFTVKKECTITALFNDGSVRLFLFTEPFNSDDIEITIDGENVKPGSKYTNGRAIEAKKKATIKFIKENYDEKYVNIWLLPSHFCSHLSLYAYNSYSIDLKIPYTCPQVCIFSPSFDSQDQKFRVSFGINSLDSNHISSLYIKSFYCPYKTSIYSQIAKAKVKNSFIVDFKFNSSKTIKKEKKEDNKKYYDNFIFYKRITNQINQDNAIQKSSIGSVAICNSTHGCVSSFFPPLEVIVEQPNWASNIELIPLSICLGASILFIVLLIILFKKCRKKMRMHSIKDDISGLIPPNSNISVLSPDNSRGNSLKDSNLIDQYFQDKPSDIPGNL